MGTPRVIESVPTLELYERWAQVYDIDGNILQAIDDLYIRGLLKQAFDLCNKPGQLTIFELGCGTGRNTAKLLEDSFVSRLSHIYAVDFSSAMLAVAKERCGIALEKLDPGFRPSIEFHQYDATSLNQLEMVEQVDLVISTLVLEHLPLDIFFDRARKFLKKDGKGVLLVTNMHPEMGKRSRAGFLDEKSGQKVQGFSYAHEVGDVIEAARASGFELYGEVKERAVTADDIGEGKALGPRGYKWIGCNVWFSFLLRLCEQP
ncbi:S-adenosyl-L-methionine-dependent methyltransferase [Xylogone sp. PMI_703]|nr:S-adenosyl-L-methionine-dependent methyltransferase [Xylogone sp. PMI_703]